MEQSTWPRWALRTLWQWLASPLFWGLTMGLFIVQAVYIALVGRFSMAFDEYYHLGSIQAYAKVWLPWSVQQPAGPATIGAVPADGSYLYHYLMSFPYRLLEHITTNLTIQIVTLRLIDVAIMVAGFYVFRRLLLRLGMGRSAAHILLWIVSLLPMTPFLAGQITYDVLWFTMTGVTLLALVNLGDTILQRHIVPLRDTCWVLSLVALTSQVKYAFLPIALAGVIFLIVLIVKGVHSQRIHLRNTFTEWRSSLRMPATIGVIALLLVSGVFFAARYGSNIVKYHTPVPACNVVLTKERCLAYGPYARDEGNRALDLDKQLTALNKLGYPFGWFSQMLRESYFAVGPLEINYPTGAPLPLSYWTGSAVAVISLLLLLARGKQLWQKGVHERLLIVLVGMYIVFLFIDNYHAFVRTGEPVAIHGRYLLSLLPPLGYLVYEAVRTLREWQRGRTYVIAGVVVVAVITAYGGGIAPFIIRSADNWYKPSAVAVSKRVRSVLWPILLR